MHALVIAMVPVIIITTAAGFSKLRVFDGLVDWLIEMTKLND